MNFLLLYVFFVAAAGGMQTEMSSGVKHQIRPIKPNYPKCLPPLQHFNE